MVAATSGSSSRGHSWPRFPANLSSSSFPGPSTSEPPESFEGGKQGEAYRYLWNKLFYPAPPHQSPPVFSYYRQSGVPTVTVPSAGLQEAEARLAPEPWCVGFEIRQGWGRGPLAGGRELFSAFLRAARGHGTWNRCRPGWFRR